jgi:hypothetical protein
MLKRVISVIVLAPILLYLVYLGGIPFLLALPDIGHLGL